MRRTACKCQSCRRSEEWRHERRQAIITAIILIVLLAVVPAILFL